MMPLTFVEVFQSVAYSKYGVVRAESLLVDFDAVVVLVAAAVSPVVVVVAAVVSAVVVVAAAAVQNIDEIVVACLMAGAVLFAGGLLRWLKLWIVNLVVGLKAKQVYSRQPA